MLLAFYKPFRVLSQFRPDGSMHQSLATFQFPKSVYPLGRLDAESEGLLLLGDEPALNAKLLLPENCHARTYLVQVEHLPTAPTLRLLEDGLNIQGHHTRPCKARLLEIEPILPPRNPPVRFRKNIPTAWLELELTEGKNRQVRRMTAAIGHPTLRLVRTQIGMLSLNGLSPGEWRELETDERLLLFKKSSLARDM